MRMVMFGYLAWTCANRAGCEGRNETAEEAAAAAASEFKAAVECSAVLADAMIRPGVFSSSRSMAKANPAIAAAAAALQGEYYNSLDLKSGVHRASFWALRNPVNP